MEEPSNVLTLMKEPSNTLRNANKGLMHWLIYLYEWVIKHIDFDEGMVVGPLFGKFNTNE